MMLAVPVFAAPQLSESDRQRLADGTTDRDDVLDEQDGLYVLLRNASTWQGGDFGGDAGAAVAPPPDYDFFKADPQAARGNVYLIEGWLAQADRYPTTDNHDRNALVRSGDPTWGDQVTRWTLVTNEKDPGATIIVLFNDPRAQMTVPGAESKVRVAARFYKLWTVNAVNGKPFTYPVFVGGAAEVVVEQNAGATSKAPSQKTIMTLAIVLVAGAFLVIRYMLNRRGGAGGSQLRDQLEAIRREREYYEHEEELNAEANGEVLPEDPAAALDVLRKKHEKD